MAFVSYDSYKNRIEKLAKFKNFVVKYKFLIIAVLAVIFGGATALMATKGMITTDMSLSSDTYVYGESYEPTTASAFLSDVGYEYTVKGKDAWSSEKPVKAGEYSVRAVSKKLIGKGYGKTVNFKILPAEITFTFTNNESDTLTYGSDPASYDYNYTGLVSAYGDRVAAGGVKFEYTYPDEVGKDVGVALKKLQIMSGSDDRSDCYVYKTEPTTYKFAAKPISFAIDNEEQTYNGKGFSFKGKPNAYTKNQLVESDTFTIDTKLTDEYGTAVTPVNAGSYFIALDGTVKVFDEKGNNITYRYEIIGTPQSGTFTVEKRSITLLSATEEWTYDGLTHSNKSFTITSGSVADGQTVTASSDVSVTNVADGRTANVLSYAIYDSSNNPVSDNYLLTENTGTLNIKPCSLNITTAGGEWEYDGTAHPVKQHTVNGLATGQQLANISYASESLTDVNDSGKNWLNYSIVWGQSGEEVDINNYNITENYGDIKITPRPLKVVTSGASRPYNGDYLTCDDFNVYYIGNNNTYEGDAAALPYKAFIYDYENLSIVGSLPQIINVGTKQNAISFRVPNDNYYIDEAKTEYGTLKITQAEITVTLDNASCAYGDTLPAPDITISGEGIVNGNLFGSDNFNPVFLYDNAAPSRLNKGTYTISLDTVNSTFAYGNSDPVTTPNYKITSNTSTLIVDTRAITVYLNDTTLVYGNELIYNLGNEAVDGIVAGQTVQVNSLQVAFDIPLAMPNAGTYDGAISCPASAITILSGATPTTSNYDVTVEPSTLYINQREIIVKAKDMLGIIYGEAIEYEVKEGNYANVPDLASGEKLTIENVLFGYQQGTINPDVDEYDITPDVTQITILKSDGITSSRSNYKINPKTVSESEIVGTLEIVERPIRIESGTSPDLVYDGTPQYDKSFEALFDNKNYYDVLSVHSIVVTDWTTVTDVAPAVQNRHGYDIVDTSGASVKGNYKIYTSSGYLKVNPRHIEVTLESYSAIYGESYSYPTGAGNYAKAELLDLETGEALVAGDTLEITYVKFGFTGSRPAVGKYPITQPVACKILKANGRDGSDGNYTVTFINGELEITKRPITVQLLTYLAEYGESYAYPTTAAGNYVKTVLPDLVAGDTLRITAVEYEFGSVQYPEVKDGGYWVREKDYEISNNGKGNYNVEFIDGMLIITKRAITVTLNDIASVAYGEKAEYILGGEKIENSIGVCTVDFDTANLKFTPAQTNATYTYPDAGAYKVDCDGDDITVLSGGDDVTHNYTVIVVSGNLEITKREITVKPTPCEIYYGDVFDYSKVEPNYEMIGGSLATFDGEQETLVIFVYSPEFDGASRPVGTYNFTPDRYTITKVDGTDSYNNYIVKFEDGTLEIKQKVINVELKDIILTYGEDDHSKKSYAELYADEIDIIVISYSEVLQLAFSFTDEDGKPVDDPHNVGDYGVVITNGETKNYKIMSNGTGKLTINPRFIHPMPFDKTEVYGTTEFSYQSGSSNYEEVFKEYYYCLPAYDEEIEIFVSYNLGGQTMPSVGKYDAFMTGVKVHYSDGTSEYVDVISSTGASGYSFATKNYYISNDYDDFTEKLEITKKKLTITLNDIEAYYGDEIKYESDGTEEADGLLTEFGHTLSIDPNGISFAQNGEPVEPENVGTYNIVTSDTEFITVFNGEDKVTKNYNITVESGGTLTINALPITVELKYEDGFSVPYGEEIPFPEITGTVNHDTITGGLIYKNTDTDEEYKTADLADKYLPAGTYLVYLDLDNYEIEYTNGAPADTHNYDIDEEDIIPASLEISPRQITITLKEFSREYGVIDYIFIQWRLNGTDALPSKVIGNLGEFIEEVGGEDGLAEGEDICELEWYLPDDGEFTRIKDVATYSLELRTVFSNRFGGGLDCIKWDNGDFHSASNYELTIKGTATLTIKPKAVTVEVGEKTTTYGNDSEVLEKWQVVEIGVAFDESLRVSSFALDGITEHPANVGTYPLDPKVFTAEVEGGSADNYAITIDGTLIIGQREITVQLYDNEAYYGEDYDYLTVSEGPYISITGGLVAVGEQTETLEITTVDYGFSGVRPNARRTAYTVQTFECEITKVDGSPSTGNYSVKWLGGELTINARQITVALDDATSIYGEPLGVPKITVEGLVGDDEFNPKYLYLKDGETPNRYNVGEYDITLDEENYSFTYENGSAYPEYKNYEIVGEPAATLTVTQRPITVTLKDIEREYGEVNADGSIIWNSRIQSKPSDNRLIGDIKDYVTIGGDYGLAEGESIYVLHLSVRDYNDASTEALAKNSGKYTLRLFRIVLEYEDGEIDILCSVDSTDAIHNGKNYEVTVLNDATVTINPKKVELDLGDIEVIYGDKDNALNGYTYTTENGFLPFSETIELTSVQVVGGDDYRLNVGTYPLDPDYNQSLYAVYDEAGEPIVLSELEELNYEVTLSGQLVVKARPVKVELIKFDGEYYYGDAELLVYPAIKGNYKSLIYYTTDGADEEKAGLAYGQQLQIEIMWLLLDEDGNVISKVAAPKNAVTYNYQIDSKNSVVYDENDNAIASGFDNYDFVYDFGEVEIKPIQLSLDLAERRSVYGEELPFVPYEFIELPDLNGVMKYEGETLKINIVYYDWNEYAYGRKVEVIPFDAGDYIYNTTQYVVYDADGTPQTAQNYVLADVWEGALYISERKITVNTANLPDVFYGETVDYKVEIGNHAEIGGEGLAEGQYLAITSVKYYRLDEEGNHVEADPVEVGTYYIVPTEVAIYDEDGNEISLDNYDISYPAIPDELSTCGTVKIMPILLHLVTNDHTWEYDGEEHYDKGYTLWLIDDAGNVTDKEFFLSEDEAKLVIVEEGYTTVKNFCENVANVVEYDFSKTNYEIAYPIANGLLNVTKREITVETTNCVKIYNGKPLTDDVCVINNGIFKETITHDYQVNYLGSITDVGDIDNAVEVTDILDENKISVIDNYIISYKFGTLTVTQRPIVVVRDSDSKEYDGTALTCTTYDYTYLFQEGPIINDWIEDGLLGDDKVYAVEGTVTELYRVGSVPNETEFAPYSDNYKVVKCIGGTLTVTERHISIALNSNPDLIYGQATYSDEYGNFTLTGGSLAVGDQLKVAVKYSLKNGEEDGSEDDAVSFVKNVGTYTLYLNELESVVQTSYDDENGLSNYVIDNCTIGEITISAKDITITLNGIENKIYGEKFAGYDTDGYTPSEELPYGDTFEVYVKYSKDGTELEIEDRTDADVYDVSLSYCIVRDEDGNDITELNNYIITSAGDVTLTIEARKIIVVTGGLRQEYNGDKHSNPTFTDTYFEGDENKAGLLPGDENVLQIVIDANEVVNVEDSTANTVEFASTSPNYEVADHDYGYLEIYKINVTVELWEITGTVYGKPLTYPDQDDNFGYAEGSRTLLDGETLKIAVKFYTKNGNELGELIDGEPKDAGSYYYVLDTDNCFVTGSLGGLENGIGNYNIDFAEKQEATIYKLDITLSLVLPWNAEDIVYNASQWALGANDYEIVAGGVDGNCEFAYEEVMELAVEYYEVGSSEPMSGAPVNAGTYTVKFNPSDSKIDGVSVGANYEVADVEDISFTINAKDITITMSDESRTYNGKVYDYITEYKAANFVSQPEGSDKIIPAEVSYNGVPKNVDTYEVTLIDFDVEGGLKSNYNLLEDASKLNCNVEIQRREIIFTVEDWSIELGTEIIPELTIGGEGFVEGEELEPVFTYYKKGDSGEWEEIAKDEIVKRGIYEVRVSFDDEEGVLANYDPTYNNGTLEVTGLKVVIIPEFNGEELYYIGEGISLEGFSFKHYHVGEEDKEVAGFAAEDVPVYLADAEDGKPYYQLLFTNTKTGESSYDAPVNAGEYEVAYVFGNIDEDKYAVYNNDTITITVAPRQVKVNIDYEENDFRDLSYTYELLPTASVSIEDTDITGNEKGILDCDSGLEVEWYFYNRSWGKEVEYNYAGVYSIMFKFNYENDNYELVNPVSGVTFTVDKAVIYITPKAKPAVDYTYEGQELALAPDDYDIRSGMLYGDGYDVLIIEGSGVLKVTRSMTVTIKNAKVMQGSEDVTDHTYDIHYTYKANDLLAGKEDWYTRSSFTTTLMFNPVQISYRLVIDDDHKNFKYDGNAQDLGIAENDIANHVEFLDGSGNVISIAEAFSVGNYDLQYILIPIIQVKVYEKWIRVLVFDQNGNNVTSLFQFSLDDSTDLIEVRGYDLHFDLTISDSALEEAWANRDSGSGDITESIYIENGYYVLKSGYVLTGYTDTNHVGEVLVRKENDKFVFKVIVYELNDKNARVERSITYSLNVPEDLSYSATLVTMGSVLRPETTTTTQADTLATIGGYSL